MYLLPLPHPLKALQNGLLFNTDGPYWSGAKPCANNFMPCLAQKSPVLKCRGFCARHFNTGDFCSRQGMKAASCVGNNSVYMTSILWEWEISDEQMLRKRTRLAGMAAVMRKMEESSVRTRPRGSILQMGGGWKWNWMRALLDGDSMSRREQMLKTPHSEIFRGKFYRIWGLWKLYFWQKIRGSIS